MPRLSRNIGIGSGSSPTVRRGRRRRARFSSSRPTPTMRSSAPGDLSGRGPRAAPKSACSAFRTAKRPSRPALGHGTIRREELTQALRKLCPTHVSVTRLGLPDGSIACHVNRLRNALLSLARGKPTLIAPCERDRHPDHEAVGGVCLKFARDLKLPIARYAIRAWPCAAAGGLRAARWGKFLLDRRRPARQGARAGMLPIAARGPRCRRALGAVRGLSDLMASGHEATRPAARAARARDAEFEPPGP